MNRASAYKIKAVLSSLENALDPIMEVLEESEADHKTCYKVRLALDELLTNIISYAYDDDNGEVEIKYVLLDEPKSVTITIIDEGKPFDPLAVDDPELGGDINERKIGGLGLFIVKNTMDEITYKREDDKNIIVIRKNF